MSLEIIKRQFLCWTPVKSVRWNDVLNDITWEGQELLCNSTVNLSVVLRYPIKISYQKTFLKHVIEKLDKQGTEVHDSLYDAYGRLVSLDETSESYRHYPLEGGNVLTLKENSSIISQGTTGLCSWQASLALSEWCIANKCVLNGKHVLELGSGVGLTGLVAGLYCDPRTYYFTDCHDLVLRVLCENIKINTEERVRFFDTTGASRTFLKTAVNSRTELVVLKLPWEEIPGDVPALGDVELILAADVVYDRNLFAPLSRAIKCFLLHGATEKVILACTERNENTLQEFLRVLETNSLAVRELPVPPQKHFVWNTEAPIRMFSICKL